MTLRRTLVVVQIALVTLGLVAFGVFSYRFYRASELRSLRTTLSSTSGSLRAALCRDLREGSLPTEAVAACSFGGANGTDPDDRTSPGGTSGLAGRSPAGTADSCGGSSGRFLYPNFIGGSLVQLRTSSGRAVAGATYRVPFGAADPLPPPGRATATTLSASPSCPDPALPAVVDPGPSGTRYLEVGATKGTGPFLVQVSRVGQQVGGGQPGSTPILVTAIPATSLNDSLHNLLLLDLAIGAVVLVVLAASTLLLVRSSLRPLERITETATAISAGDLSRRVPADGRTEVGRLGTALNRMLGRIEGAFAERDATEQRLRQFLADASHELRTPLTSIRGFAELWRLQHQPGLVPDPDRTPIDAGEAMARIERHARAMGDMIEELLLLARLDETPGPSAADRRQPVELELLAAEACDVAASLDPGRPIRLEATAHPIVLGDRLHLQRAVTNLAVNAVRHTPANTPVDVAVGVDGGVAELVVRDHGAGLDPEGLRHAFDRFWQADASRATGGTGLGLAIVAGIAAEHGGSAAARNAPDGGAVFVLRLPLASASIP